MVRTCCTPKRCDAVGCACAHSASHGPERAQPFAQPDALRHVALRAISGYASPIMAIERIQLHTHGDDRGLLISLEQQRNVPFEIRRVYYLFGTRHDV
ncbi:WxcM-like domain-containing protein, partial [Xanthomonas perforans]|uniref:WxcM-like domain-containing protein n=1 Tax=Xanthomonas perforans TaxID=442694 RepID=UPI00387E5620